MGWCINMIIKNCEVIFPKYFAINHKNDKFAVIECDIGGTDVFDSLTNNHKIMFGSLEQSDEYDVIIGVVYESSKSAIDCDKAFTTLTDNHGHKYFIVKNTPNLSESELATLCEHGYHNGLFDHCLDEDTENFGFYEVDEKKFKANFQTIAPNKYLFIGE